MHFQFKVTSAVLTLLAAASALPYDQYGSQLFAGRVARTQTTEDTSACVAVVHSRNGVNYRVRVCTADEEG